MPKLFYKKKKIRQLFIRNFNFGYMNKQITSLHHPPLLTLLIVIYLEVGATNNLHVDHQFSLFSISAGNKRNKLKQLFGRKTKYWKFRTIERLKSAVRMSRPTTMQRFFRRLQQRLVWIYSRRNETVEAQRDDLLRMGECETDNVRTEQRPAYRCWGGEVHYTI